MPDTPLLGPHVRLLTLDLDDTLIDTDRCAPQRIDVAIATAQALVDGAVDAATVAEARAEALALDPQSGRLTPILRGFGVVDDRPLAEQIRAAYNARLFDLLEIFDGVPETLAALRQHYALVVVTNGPVDLQEGKLAKFGLRTMVDHVVISEAVGMRKPDPAIFHYACSLVGVAPADAAHVGDSPRGDVAGAKDAGLTAIWRRPDYPRDWPEGTPRPDAVIGHLRELLAD